MPRDEVNVNICHGCHRSGNDQGKKIPQGQGKVCEFHFKSGKIEIFSKKSGRNEILRVHIYSFPSTFIVFIVSNI